MKTLKYFSLLVLSLALVVISMPGCAKKKDENANAKRNVKYELSGTYTGKFTVLITDNESGSQVYDNVTIPWSKEVTYPEKVIAIGIGTSTTTDGAAGQTAFLKIYSNGSVVKSTNATADNNGGLSLPSLGHSF